MPFSTLLSNITPPSSAFSSYKPSNPQHRAQSYPSRTKNKLFRDAPPAIGRRSGRASASSSSWIGTDYDLYEILGVDSSSDQSEIKKAYRALQKRCHPDIAGAAGHDMAIILNDVYSFLSDPASRSAYDQEQAKQSVFRGYTGKPLYSTWFGSEAEQRAVFVDELKCVGCLKCALFANKTFAIESAYGRARVVAQWADPDDKILDAIQTCPVDCISIVERSNLAALEFLMSKQPRGIVRMTGGNTGGVRVSNIFADVEKFQSRYQEKKDKASDEESRASNLHQEARASAVQGIRSITNWWYWRPPTNETTNSLVKLLRNSNPTQPNTERLKEAAAKFKARNSVVAASCDTRMSYKHNEEYWMPTFVLPSPSKTSNTTISSSEPPLRASLEGNKELTVNEFIGNRKANPVSLMGPLMTAMVSATIIGLKGKEMGNNGLEEHVGNEVALKIVNSFELQVLLAGATWFVIGMAMFGLFEALGSKGVFRR